jgi:uroporphyrinogen-III synthase
MRVLVTQSAEDAAASIAALQSRGHDVLAVPLVTAERAPPPKINLAGAQGFLVTSAEGARALADNVGVRTFPVFADSEVTATALRALGFKDVHAAKDDAADLAKLVERTLKPANGALMYASSTAAPVNLPAMLSNMGFAVRPLPLYSIKRVDQLPAALRDALQNSAVDAALFLTPDEARAFVTLVQREDVEPLVRTLTAVAATPVVAAPLRALKLGAVSVPDVANLEALFDAFSHKFVDRVEEERLERARRDKEAAAAEAERQRAAAEDAAKARAEQERIAQEKAAQAEAKRARLEQERLADEEAARAREARAQQERAQKERLAHEKAAAEKAERKRRVAEKAEQERIAREKAAAEKAERARLATERAAAERLAREKEAAERAAQERIAAEKATALKIERDKAAAEQAEQDRVARERVAAEKADRERIAAENAAALKAERDKVAAAEVERDRLERERLAAEKAERDRIAQEDIARAKSDQERLALERAEQQRQDRERSAAEKAEQDRITREKAAVEKAERERRAAEQAERDRLAREHHAAEKAEQERLAREKAAAERAERERLAAERAEQDRIERARRAAEEAEQERIAREKAAAEKAERDRVAAEQAERNRIEGERLAAEKAERDRVAREKATAEKAERERLAAEKVERQRVEREAAAAAKTEQQRLRAEEKARAAAAKALEPPRESLGKRLSTWMVKRRASAPEPAYSTLWAMQAEKPAEASLETAPREEAAAMANTPSSATMAPAVAAPVDLVDEPQTKELAVSDHSPTTPPDITDAAANRTDAAGDSKSPRGGRAARLLAEDAADLRAKDQRFKYLGHSDAPAPEPEADRQSTASAATMQKSRSGGIGRTFVLFLVLVAMAGAVIGTASWWVPRVTQLVRSSPQSATATGAGTDLQADIVSLKARVGVLEQEAVNTVTPDALNAAQQDLTQRLAALEARTASPDGAVTSIGESVSSQAKQLAAVTARLATLEAAIGNAAQLDDVSKRLTMLEGRAAEAQSVLALSDRVTALETTARRTMVEQSSNIALLMAVSQWREALLAGHPFALELQTTKALAARVDVTVDDSAFADAATRGVPTLADLQRQFSPAAAAAMRASAVPDGTSAWYRRILDRVLSIVTVRRLDGDAAGMNTAAVLARAENRLNAGDLAAAVAEMENLTGAAAIAAQAWQTQAKARVAAERAAADVATKAVAAVAAAGKAQEADAPKAPTSGGR